MQNSACIILPQRTNGSNRSSELLISRKGKRREGGLSNSDLALDMFQEYLRGMRGIIITNVELIPQECRFSHGGIPSIRAYTLIKGNAFKVQWRLPSIAGLLVRRHSRPRCTGRT